MTFFRAHFCAGRAPAVLAALWVGTDRGRWKRPFAFPILFYSECDLHPDREGSPDWWPMPCSTESPMRCGLAV
jgi:hypothetical protein